MNTTDIHSKPPLNQLPEAAREIARQVTVATKDIAKNAAGAARDIYNTVSTKVEDSMALTNEYAQQALDVTKVAAQRASDATKDIYHSASAKIEDAMVISKKFIGKSPIIFAFGALVTGIAIGCMIGMAQREEPSFRHRFF